MPNYTVQQGDHLSGIAEQFGFRDINTIWNHPNNAQLKQDRKDPHILFPGDQVFIPDKEQKAEIAPTTKQSTFQLGSTKLKLNLRLKDINDDPVSNKPVTISVEGAVVPPPSTDGDGKTSSEIKNSAKAGFLVLGDLQFPLKIGHLDPVDKPSGQAARLNNLGYEAGDPRTIGAESFQAAVEEFQCDNGLPVNGNCDSTTQTKLAEIHGC